MLSTDFPGQVAPTTYPSYYGPRPVLMPVSPLSSMMRGGFPGVGYYASPFAVAPFGMERQVPVLEEGVLIDDEAVRELVYEAIDNDPTILAEVDIDVEVSAGVVTLKGRVPGKRTKHAVGDAAWWIPSVVDVNNQLEVSRRRERRPHRVEATARGAA